MTKNIDARYLSLVRSGALADMLRSVPRDAYYTASERAWFRAPIGAL